MIHNITTPNHIMDSIIQETFLEVMSLRTGKGVEYAGTQQDDCLANFRRNGHDSGVSMETCWRIYAGKHWDAISQHVRDIATGMNRPLTEPMEGRVNDLITYLCIYKAMLRERRLVASKINMETQRVWNSSAGGGSNAVSLDPNPNQAQTLPAGKV